MEALITKSTGLWYEADSADGKLHVRLKGKFKLEDKKLTNPLAVGDFVELESNEQMKGDWIIKKIHPRKNYVIRQSPRKKGHHHMIASNIDQGVLVATLAMPRTSMGFIDRFLVTLETFRIPGVIIFNKSDIYKQKHFKLFEEIKEIYEKVGYKVFLVSLMDGEGDDIVPVFQGKVSLLTGHSGSGKSTLINSMIPNAEQEVNAISSFANKGVHTTTFAELFYLNDDSKLIDTPGIKELGLSEIEEEELSHYFPEMREHLGSCKFHNCLHLDEPGCIIKAQIGSSISMKRYESYVSILKNEDNRK